MYDERTDPTVGGAVAAAISRLIGAHIALGAGGSIISVREMQGQLAKSINDYLAATIEPAA